MPLRVTRALSTMPQPDVVRLSGDRVRVLSCGVIAGRTMAGTGVYLCEYSRDGERVVLAVDDSTSCILGTLLRSETLLRSLTWRQSHMAERRFLQQAAAKHAAVDNEWAVQDVEWQKRYPGLFEFMASNVNADGQPRARSKVTVFADGGVWKATLTDVETEQSLFVTLKAPEDVFKALEKAVTATEADWRGWRYTDPKAGKRGPSSRGR